MLRVIVQVTGSSMTAPNTIMVLDIQNDSTGTWEIGNYNVELVSHEERGVRKARVEGHLREEGALRLIQKAIEKIR